jgi:hypothetical protein
MPKRDITFEIIRLLSQQIVSDSQKYPEGPLLQNETEDKDIIKFIDQTEDFIEKIGLSRWIKGELTHLGFRAGLKYHENIDVLEEQAIDETDVYSGAEE